MAAPTRREFLAAVSTVLTAAAMPVQAQQRTPAQGRGGPRAHEFVFARLRYDSGDWDYNPKVAANVLNSVVEYTNIPVYPEEVVITADSDELPAFPFLFMTGHKLVRFSDKERERLRTYVERGGLLFSDDCNHDVAGLYAVSFEAEMRRIFPQSTTLAKLPNAHPLYRAYFPFDDGPPQTAHELNGWGDDLVHDYLRGVEHQGRLGVLYSNKDYGCEWDYDWRNKRFQRDDNTKFAINIVSYALTA
ncbi:MAG: DUF4159 domain-containing protein [Acidobacteria bacterium]|nr:DUF4159 domain-containing protein [Acidobacteriota bacterium]